MANASPARRVLDSRLAFCLVLAVPGAWWLFAYVTGVLFYGEVVHATGRLSARLLILTLAMTPLSRVLPRARWLGWLRRRRRYLGVAAFGYALFHAVVYVARQPAIADVLGDARTAAMWTAWIALMLMLALAATSNDASVRRLGRRWKLLHRAAYAAAVLSFAHWILSAFDPIPAYLHLGVLVAVEALRFSPAARRS
jgi:methionine sulfoxide reductase heme-binding subunit